MRGDIVAEPMIVTEIIPYKDYVCMDFTGLPVAAKFSQINPIPLTSKILERNGFENINDVMWEFRTQKTCIKLEWRGKIMVEITNKMTNKDEQGRCNIAAYTIGWAENMYVHELQLALKLCGIKKEIVL